MSDNVEDLDHFLEVAGEFGSLATKTIAKILHRLAWGETERDEHISLPAAAKLLGLAESTLRAAINRGELNAIRRGPKLLFFNRNDIRRYGERKGL